ncbi:MAG: hypothetical protein ABFS08_03800 [Pseudomonadota bacterium]
MKKYAFIPLSLLAMLAVAAAPVHAKKPGSEESSLPKGLQKKVARGGQLPPGWEKKLKKGAVLDPAVVSHGTPVSAKLRATLPLGSKGSVDITLDGRVIRLHEKTRQVLNVFDVRL